MPDDNRFAGLADDVDEGAESKTDEATGGADPGDDSGGSGPETAESRSSNDESDSRESAPSQTADDVASSSPDTDSGAVTDAGAGTSTPSPSTDVGGPAFPFDATNQESIYVRPETLEAVDDAEFEVEVQLRQEYDVRDLTGREFQDALLRVAAENPDRVAAAIVAERQQTPNRNESTAGEGSTE